MRRPWGILPVLAALPGCRGDQSAFLPRGAEAERIERLFWVMTVAGTAVLAAVMLLAALALVGRGRGWLSSERFVLGAGLALPAVALTALLGYGVALMGAGAASAARPEIAVDGEQWWWRVTYLDEDGRRIETANELHLPVGRPVAIELTAADVIHSFWVPALAGKLDMIPGRTNVLTLTATEAGVSRGQCAEYCGGAHALMAFYVIAEPEAEFRAWLEAEAAPAREPATEDERRGRELFVQGGCGACHAVRGTEAAGRIGPDLTHVGSRMTLAAGELPNDAEAFARWIRFNQHIKPGNEMPPYTIFTEAELLLLGRYLEGLQ